MNRQRLFWRTPQSFAALALIGVDAGRNKPPRKNLSPEGDMGYE